MNPTSHLGEFLGRTLLRDEEGVFRRCINGYECLFAGAIPDTLPYCPLWSAFYWGRGRGIQVELQELLRELLLQEATQDLTGGEV